MPDQHQLTEPRKQDSGWTVTTGLTREHREGCQMNQEVEEEKLTIEKRCQRADGRCGLKWNVVLKFFSWRLSRWIACGHCLGGPDS